MSWAIAVFIIGSCITIGVAQWKHLGWGLLGWVLASSGAVGIGYFQ
jgi:hypothetical protein